MEILSILSGGNGEQMLSAVKTISDFLEHTSIPEEEKSELLRKLHKDISGGHYNKEFADEQISKMYHLDKSGHKHTAPYWTDDEMDEVYKSVKSKIPSAYTEYDFAVALNMLKSDYDCMLKSWFAEEKEEQIDEKVIDMAVAYLNDPDAQHPDEKVWYYFN